MTKIYIKFKDDTIIFTNTNRFDLRGHMLYLVNNKDMEEYQLTEIQELWIDGVLMNFSKNLDVPHKDQLQKNATYKRSEELKQQQMQQQYQQQLQYHQQLQQMQTPQQYQQQVQMMNQQYIR